MKTKDPDEQFPSESIKEIPKWTRRYAQNRTVPRLLSLFLFLAWALAARGTGQLARESFRAGNMIEFSVAVAIVAVLVGVPVWFMVPSWGGGWIRKVAKRIYRKEGNVALPVPGGSGWRRLLPMSFVILGFPISFALTRLGYIPSEYVQPVSALYAVPFLIATFTTMRSNMSPIFLLWPILYCAHAILVVVGAPIQFTGRLDLLNMLIPTVGYGILTGAVGFLFGQYSLKRLRDVASGGETKP